MSSRGAKKRERRLAAEAVAMLRSLAEPVLYTGVDWGSGRDRSVVLKLRIEFKVDVEPLRRAMAAIRDCFRDVAHAAQRAARTFLGALLAVCRLRPFDRALAVGPLPALRPGNTRARARGPFWLPRGGRRRPRCTW